MKDNSINTGSLQAAGATHWQFWGLVKQELLFLCWALMDVAIIAPIGLVVMRWAQFWNIEQLSFWLLLLILVPFNLVRLLSALELAKRYQWRVLFITLIFVLFLSWRGLLYAPRPMFSLDWLGEFFSHLGELADPLWAHDIAIFLFVLIAWWRGLRLAQMTPDIYRIGLRLRAGILILAPVALILQATGRFWEATPFVLLYFVAGLTAVALIRAEQIEREHSGFAASLTPRWVATVFLTSLLTVLMAGFAAALISGEAIRVFSSRLGPLWAALVSVTAVSLSTVLFLFTPLLNLLIIFIGWLAEIFSRLFSGLRVGLGSEGLGTLDALQPFNFIVRDEGLVTLDLPPNVSRSLVAIAMLFIAAIITFALTRLFRQPPSAGGPQMARVSASVIDEPEGSLGERILQRLGLMRRWRTAASIRRIYHKMCLVAADAGYPRGISQTPYEYLETLSLVWPHNLEDSHLITEAFVRVRYGEVPETYDELQVIRTAWQRLAAIQVEVSGETQVAAVRKQ